MNVIQSIILGIIQGLTEFLPISSSGHLVIVPYLLGWDIPARDAFIFDVLVQVATLVAVVAYFWKDLITIGRAMIGGIKSKSLLGSPDARLGWYILLATIPAGIAGWFLKDIVERAFASLTATAVALLVTAALLLIAEKVGQRDRDLGKITWKDAVWIGFFQILAIFPGVSRSGSTISGGMTCNLERPSAARFAFLMSIPIMLAAGILATVDLLNIPNLGSLLPLYIPGFISAAVVGYLAIRWLIGYLNHHSLIVFAVYCTVVGLISLGLSFTI